VAFAAGDSRNDVLVRRVMYLLLKRLERERRVIVGPIVKPSDRLVEEIVRTPRVRKVIEELAGEGERERFIVEARARAMLREMAAAMEPDVIRWFGTFMEAVFHRIYDGLEIDKAGVERIREAARHGTVILLPSHKSHIDYLFVSYVLWRNDITPPLIAAGDNLAFFPLGSLFRRAGAFFIRRKIANDRLYGAILDAYVHKLVKEGYSIEFFLEGGRSRTGKLLPPKLGLLSMVVDAAYEVTSRPVYFVPISIGYERVVEAKSYVKELSGGEKEGESVTAVIRAARVLAERYGRLNLQVGELLTLDRIRKDVEATSRAAPGKSSAFVPKRAIIARLGHQLIYEINRATAVTGGSLVAMALLVQPGRGVTRSRLMATCDALLEKLRAHGARLQASLKSQENKGISHRAVDDAIGLFASAGWVEVHEEDDVEGDKEPVYVVPDDKRLSIDISKNVIVHFFVPYALIATAMDGKHVRAGGAPTPLGKLRDRVRHLSRLFKFEFMFRADASFEAIFDQAIDDLVAEKTLRRSVDSAGNQAVSVIDADDARARIDLWASTIASFLEGYRVAARALTSLAKSKAGLAQKDLVKRALSTGRRMHLAGEVVRREGICRPVIENAIAAFLDQGYLAKSDGKLVMNESFATIAAVSAIERRIAAYLPGAPASEIEA
jgi:glycerol-3-phosphate O-acyltransferase